LPPATELFRYFGEFGTKREGDTIDKNWLWPTIGVNLSTFFTNIPMKKHLFWLILIGLNVTIVQAQQIKIDTLISPPGTYRFRIDPDIPPRPLTEADAERAAWNNFWMFSDGFYSKQSVVVRTFPDTGSVGVTLKRRGKYSSDDEPPPANRTINVSPPLGTVPTIPSLAPEAEIVLEWNAARMGDPLYAAIVVRNKTNEPRFGYVKLHYPTVAFQNGIDMVYPLNALETTVGSNDPVSAVDGYLAGRIQEWDILRIAPNSERVIFVKLQFNSTIDTNLRKTFDLWLDWRLESLGSAAPSGGAPVTRSAQSQVGEVNKQAAVMDDKKFEPSAASPTEPFNGRTHVTVNISYARDPNGLTVLPAVIYPTKYMPTHLQGKPIDLAFTGFIENMGNAIADSVTFEIRFPSLIDKSTYVQGSETKPSCENLEPPQRCLPVTLTQWTTESILLYPFSKIRLLPNTGPGATDRDIAKRKARFEFDIATKPNLVFNHGDKIVTDATVRMFHVPTNGTPVMEDELDPAPAIVNVLKPGRMPFGLIFGIKAHSHLANSDSAKGQGLSLTLRCPLFRPRGNSIESEYLQYMPRFYWQFELGYGQGAFQQPSDNQRFEVNYLHFTPVQLRYLHPVNLTSFLRYIGVSAGYSADYALSGKVNGRTTPLPSGFFDRFENELAVSLDFTNRLNVPSVTLGIGYKFRQNNLTGQSVSYSLPFVYAQLDVIRFRRHFAQVWNTVHRW